MLITSAIEWTDELEPVFVDPFTERVGPNVQLPSTPLEVFLQVQCLTS